MVLIPSTAVRREGGVWVRDKSARESIEVGKKGRKNLVNNPLVGYTQHGLYPRAINGFWRTFPERYVEGRGVLHVHLRPSFRGREIPQDFCAAFYGLKDGLDGHGERVGDEKGALVDAENPQVGKSVLVLDRKVVKYREDMVRCVPLPSLVGLQFLDDCLRLWVDAPDFVTAFVGSHSPIGEDGKLHSFSDLLGERSTVADGERVRKVVESGAEVVQAVSSDDGEFRRKLLKEFDYHHLLASLGVEIMDESVRLCFEPTSGFGFKAVQVVERPR
jgi:hypothetical protein